MFFIFWRLWLCSIRFLSKRHQGLTSKVKITCSSRSCENLIPNLTSVFLLPVSLDAYQAASGSYHTFSSSLVKSIKTCGFALSSSSAVKSTGVVSVMRGRGPAPSSDTTASFTFMKGVRRFARSPCSTESTIITTEKQSLVEIRVSSCEIHAEHVMLCCLSSSVRHHER
jgi:hypothetical protein